MTRGGTAVPAVVVAIGVLVLAGCSPRTPGPDDPPVSASPGAGTSARHTGPLEEMLLQRTGGGDASVAEDPAAAAVEQTRVVEERVAACMTAAGFEYTPQVPAVADVVVGTGPAQGSAEFVERYGYGIANPPPDTVDGISWSLEGSDWEYVSSLSAAAKEAYDDALWGPVTATEGDVVTREGGCRDTAWLGPTGTDAFAGLSEEASTFLAALGDDPAFAQVDTAWSGCMSEQGYLYADPDAAVQDFVDRSTALIDPETRVSDPEGTAALAEDELATAAADLACRAQTGYDEEHATIADELQQEWVDLHRTELDAWQQASEQ